MGDYIRVTTTAYDAVGAGIDRWGEQRVEVTREGLQALDEAERSRLAVLVNNEPIRLSSLMPEATWAGVVGRVRADLWEAAERDLARREEQAREEVRERERAAEHAQWLAALLSTPPEDLAMSGLDRREQVFQGRVIRWEGNALADLARRVDAVIEARRQARERETEAREAEARAEAAARRVFYAEWLDVHGSDNERARWRENLLSEQEIEASIGAWLFGRFDGQQIEGVRKGGCTYSLDVAPYKRLSAKALDKGCYHDGFEVDIRTAESLPAATYEAYWAIRALAEHELLPIGAELTVTPRAHAASCSECKGELVRYGAMVEARWEGRVYAREFGLEVPCDWAGPRAEVQAAEEAADGWEEGEIIPAEPVPDLAEAEFEREILEEIGPRSGLRIA